MGVQIDTSVQVNTESRILTLSTHDDAGKNTAICTGVPCRRMIVFIRMISKTDRYFAAADTG